MTAKKERNTTAKVAGGLFRSRSLHRGLVAALLLSTSSVALHAEDRDLQRELDALKAQISSLKAAVAEQRSETKKNKEKIKVVADRAIAPPVAPPGYTAGGFQPIGGYDDKKLHFGGITLTPGGYVAAEGIFRSRTTGADVTTPFAAVNFPNNPLANTQETRFSVRQSRAALLVEANITPSILGAGYFEADFNSAGATTSFTQTNPFTFRVRNIYATLDFLDTGFHVLAGQNWSLITTNSKGITPRNEVLPPGPESGVQAGYLYARNPGIRLVKDFDKKLWLAISAEESATVINGCGATGPVTAAVGSVAPAANLGAGVAQVTCQQGSGALGSGNIVQTTSLQHIPDIFGKVAYEARIADRDVHLEGVGVYRNFYDRVNYGQTVAAANGGGFTGTSTNQNRNGFGVGGSIVAAVVPKVLDFTAQGYTGRGLGRYTSSGLADATISSNGAVTPLRNLSGNAGFTFHATSKLDFYAYAGIDKVFANYAASGLGNTFIGYGSPSANNSGCYIEGSANCTGVTGSALELTGGVWDKIYEGPFGYFRAGVQYEFVRRQLLPDGAGRAPSVNNHVIFTSLRYFPF